MADGAKRRRSLSNIIGAVILIAATVVGGLLVYNYFQRSLGAFMSMSNNVVVTASESPLSNNESAIYVKVTNDESSTVYLIGVYLVMPNGTVVPISSAESSLANQSQLMNVINPGQSTTRIYVVKGYYTSLYIAYKVDGTVYYTQPVSLG